MRTLPALLLAFAVPAAPSAAADPRGDHPDARPLSPQEQLGRFKVPEGFEVQLVASEPEIQKPVNLNFDASGRLWVTGSELYPWPASTDAAGAEIPGFEKMHEEIANAFGSAGKAPAIERVGKDSIRVLSDFDESGRATRIAVFADRLNIPTGILPLPRKPGAKGDSVIAYSTPTIWRFDDTDGDGVADRRTPLYTGFGYLDTHGMSSNYVHWLDGWIYGCHGFRNSSEITDRNGQVLAMHSGNTYRFKSDGSRIEYWSHGQTNPFGLAFDPRGNLYSADSHSKPVYLVQRGGYYEGIGKRPDGLGYGPRVTDDDHGSSAIAGISYYADRRWPEEFHGNVFNGNPVTGRVNRATLAWDGSSPKATRVEDLLHCDDPWFRPVQTKLGPDGALYIADFYNPVIGHYELPLNHPSRDRVHGRIWRVVWKGAGAAERRFEDLTRLDAAALGEVLGDANLEARRLAVHEASARLADPAASAQTAGSALTRAMLERLLEGGTPEQQVSALWVLARAGAAFGDEQVAKIEGAGDPLLRLHWILVQESLGGRAAAGPGGFSRLAAAVAGDPHGERALVHWAAAHPSEEGLAFLLGTFKSAGNSADVQFEYARRVALREILSSPEGYDWLSAAAPAGAVRQLLAEVSLAVARPEAADFLVGHLEAGAIALPRADDFLRHVAQHLAVDRIPALVERVGRGEVPAGQQLALADGLSSAGRSRGVEWPAAVREWVEHLLVTGLAAGDDQLVERAIAGLREARIEAKREPLAAIVADSGRPEPLRLAALEALSNLPTAPSVLIRVAADPTSPLRRRAVELLGQQLAAEQVPQLVEILAGAPAEVSTAIASVLVRSAAGLEALLTSVEAGQASPALLRHPSVAGTLAEVPPAQRERVAELTGSLPAEDERLDGIIAERVKLVGTLEADAGRGAALYQQQCAACHQLGGAGGNLGPNLDAAGARGLHRLVEDILDPNRNVDPAFRQIWIETRDGRTLQGINPRDQGELLVMDDATGQEVSVAKAEVKSQKATLISLMPAVFEQTLTPQDLADLIARLNKE
jgi:putative heme-binding domain-containing protein